MALDTRDKRGSSIGVGVITILPVANRGINEGDRQQIVGLYRGISSGGGGSFQTAWAINSNRIL